MTPLILAGNLEVMPQPHGTYLRIQGQSKTRQLARQSKTTVAKGRTEQLAGFYRAVAASAEAELDEWYRWTSALVSDVKNDVPAAREDKTREKLSAVLGEVRKILETAKDYKQLEGRLQAPVYPVLRGSRELPAVGIELGLVIAVCQILEVLVRIRKRASSDA